MTEKRTINAHYLKRTDLPTIYADGAWGGVTPRGLISIALYSERNPIPTEQELDIEDGRIVGDRITQTREGIIRSVEAEVFMTPAAARSIAKWLLQKCDEADLSLREKMEGKEEH